MKYFIDTEFLEGTQKTLFGKTKPTIDLISIGIVCEDGREYYSISKDFNIKEAWNRYDLKNERTLDSIENDYIDYHNVKVYWIRDNVLRPIYKELHDKENLHARQALYRASVYIKETDFNFTYRNLKKLISKYGKTNKQIAKEIKHFVANRPINTKKEQWILDYDTKDVQFYGYYSDYDWVVFCWLFGKMIDLPKGFPMYCNDLKQSFDELQQSENDGANHMISCGEIGYRNVSLKERKDYPKQENEHNALSDARWNKQLYEFLNG